MNIVAVQKQAVISMVGAVNAEIRQALERNIDYIWCAAAKLNCNPTLTFLYAQKEAVDFALLWLAPKVSSKKGFGESYRVSQGAARARADSRLDGASQGWSCDWSNTGSFAVHQTNGDSWTRARSESDSESYSFFSSHTWARGRSRSDEHSRAESVRQSTTTRLNEGESRGALLSFGHTTEESGDYVSTPVVDEVFQHDPIIRIGVCKDPFLAPESSCPPGNWFVGPFDLQFSGPIRPSPPDLPEGFFQTPFGCFPTLVTCSRVPTQTECGEPPDERDALFENFPRMPMCLRRNYSSSAEVQFQIYIPIPALGSFSLGGTWGTSLEQKPRCAQSRASAFTESESLATVYMRSRASGRTEARSDGFGFRQNDSHVRGRGDAEGYSNARSATISGSVSRSETHSGSNTDSHGESQSSSNTESETRARNFSWQKTTSDRIHQFDIQKYSDAFVALHALRERIWKQIEQTRDIFKSTQFANAKVRDTEVDRRIQPQSFARGQTRFTRVCVSNALRTAWGC